MIPSSNTAIANVERKAAPSNCLSLRFDTASELLLMEVLAEWMMLLLATDDDDDDVSPAVLMVSVTVTYYEEGS